MLFSLFLFLEKRNTKNRTIWMSCDCCNPHKLTFFHTTIPSYPHCCPDKSSIANARIWLKGAFRNFERTNHGEEKCEGFVLSNLVRRHADSPRFAREAGRGDKFGCGVFRALDLSQNSWKPWIFGTFCSSKKYKENLSTLSNLSFLLLKLFRRWSM